MNTNSSAMSGMAQTEHTSKTRLNEFQKVIEEGEEVKEKVTETAMSTHTTNFLPLGGVFDWA